MVIGCISPKRQLLSILADLMGARPGTSYYNDFRSSSFTRPIAQLYHRRAIHLRHHAHIAVFIRISLRDLSFILACLTLRMFRFAPRIIIGHWISVQHAVRGLASLPFSCVPLPPPPIPGASQVWFPIVTSMSYMKCPHCPTERPAVHNTD